MASSVLDVLYPPRCVGCERGIRSFEQPLCARCVSGLERVDPMELRQHIRSNVPDFAASSVFALWMFDKGGVLQRAQHALKYGQRPAYGDRLGAALGTAWFDHYVVVPDLIVPIPLHRTRRLERGYNQSEMLALGLAKRLSIRVEQLALSRVNVTRRQTGLTRQARQENVAGVFRADPNLVRGQRVLLIDDVVTTGATAASAIDALLDAGADFVDFVALAHARS